MVEGLDLDLELNDTNHMSSSSNDTRSFNLNNNSSNEDLFGIEMITNKKKQRKSSNDGSSPVHNSNNDSGFFSNMFGNDNNDNNNRPVEVSAESILNSNNNTSEGVKSFDFDNALNDIDLKNIDNSTSNIGEDMVGPSFPNLGNSTTSFNTSTNENLSSNNIDNTNNNYEHYSAPRSLTYEEIQKEKFIYLNKLERLKDKGVRLPKTYSMASDLEEMKSDFNTLDNHRRMRNSIKFQRKILVSAISGIEKGNKYFNPMDIQLDGWSQDFNDNINELDDIFEELYDKYKEYIDTSPELKLIGAVATSGFMFHMNKSLASSVFDKIAQSNPDLMNQFVNHTENAMKNQMNNSGNSFGNMMGDMMGRRNNKHMNDEPTLYNPMDGPPFTNPQDAPHRDEEFDNVDDLINKLGNR